MLSFSYFSSKKQEACEFPPLGQSHAAKGVAPFHFLYTGQKSWKTFLAAIAFIHIFLVSAAPLLLVWHTVLS